jgi:hypothetical protein
MTNNFLLWYSLDMFIVQVSTVCVPVCINMDPYMSTYY